MKETPREHLSWSQLNLWEKSPAEYIQRYVYSENRTNPRMELGKAVAQMLESDEVQENKDLEFFRIFVPKFPEKEYRIETVSNGIKLLGILDGWDPEKLYCGEYKTGSCWTQKMADETGQLDFYALLLYLKYGIQPKDLRITLFWLPTILDPLEGVKLNGELKSFETRRTMRNVLEIAGRSMRAWKGIKKACAEEYAALGIV